MKRQIACIHTSAAAIAPIMQYYGQMAPEFEITNLLDDGVLRFFRGGDLLSAERRFREMLAAASAYRAELGMITCSALPKTLMANLRESVAFPLLKIDTPMAEQAVRLGRRIGVVVTFLPTLAPTTDLLKNAAAEAGVTVELSPCVVDEAYAALLGGDPERHDALVLDAIRMLEGRDLDSIVPAQVSMARLLPKIEGRVRIPCLSSLPASLEAVRRSLP